MRRQTFAAMILAGLLFWTGAAQAFVIFRGGDGNFVKWDWAAEGGSLPYLINPTKDGDTLGGPDPVTVFQDSFSVWLAVPTTVASVTCGGTTGIDTYGLPVDDSNVLLFVKDDPDLASGVLAVTLTMYETTTGRIVETDIAFNDDFIWHTGTGEPLPGTYDLATVATHEIGHFLGLDHSFEANVAGSFDPDIACTMWPFYFGPREGSTLEDDDIAGITAVFPDEAARAAAFGAITGRVDTWDGQPLFGIHVAAITAAGKIPTVGTLSAITGFYQIDNLPPDSYYLYIDSPSISGKFYTSFVAPYWSGADEIKKIFLYRRVGVRSAASLADGDPVFNRAKLLTVTAGTTLEKINFVLGSPPSDHDDSGGCGELAGAPGWSGTFAWLLPVAAGLGWRRFRRK